MLSMTTAPTPDFNALPSNRETASASYPQVVVGLNVDDMDAVLHALMARADQLREIGQHQAADSLWRAANHVNDALFAVRS